MRSFYDEVRSRSSHRDLGPEPEASDDELGWLLETLGYTPLQDWADGQSWKLDDTYIVIEESPDGTGPHERTTGGLNHLALFSGSRRDVDTITEAAAGQGWNLLFTDRHPHAGGPDHYASYTGIEPRPTS